MANHEALPNGKAQDMATVESFAWEFTERSVYETPGTLYRKLFESRGVWFDHYDGKVVADVGSGGGRFTWAFANLTKAREIISVELSEASLEKQREYILDERVRFLQGDMAVVKFSADVIFAAGVIQHTRDPAATLKNLVGNLNEGGEIFVSFYMRTAATRTLEPARTVLKRVPKQALWAISPLLAPLFMVHPEGREGGFRNAVHTAYDWFGSHSYQHYLSEVEIESAFAAAGVHPRNVIRIDKGLYKARRGTFPLEVDWDHELKF